MTSPPFRKGFRVNPFLCSTLLFSHPDLAEWGGEEEIRKAKAWVGRSGGEEGGRGLRCKGGSSSRSSRHCKERVFLNCNTQAQLWGIMGMVVLQRREPSPVGSWTLLPTKHQEKTLGSITRWGGALLLTLFSAQWSECLSWLELRCGQKDFSNKSF